MSLPDPDASHAPHADRPSSSSRRRIVVAAAVVGCAIAAAVIGTRLDQPPDPVEQERSKVSSSRSPRARSAWEALVAASPYQNVKPNVKYVDDARCAECHDDIAADYAKHPMGRSLESTPAASAIEQFTTEANHPLKLDRLVYEVRREGARQFHRETRLSPAGDESLTMEFEAAYSVGSGRTGRSYFIEREGHFFMSPLTWYAGHGWDLSPGYEVANSHFNRPVISECLFCHSNRTLHVEGTLNEYRPPFFAGHAIGCQRCHGPGELHVAAREDAEVPAQHDTTIVNPARLEPPLRESVCEQCHLGGYVRVESSGRKREDFRPGVPWSAVEAVYLLAASQQDDHGKESRTAADTSAADDADRFVGHVEQMHQSGCYVASRGKLGCISCHDPHRLPAAAMKAEFYRQRCLTCHGEGDCGLALDERRERQSDDSCFACHMPRAATQVRHAAVTDHRIPRSPESAPKHVSHANVSPDWSPFIAFRPLSATGEDKPQTPGKSAEEMDAAGAPGGGDTRNLGLAIVLAMGRRDNIVDDRMLLRASRLLAEAVERNPDDVPARQGYALALAETGEPAQALRELEEVLRRQPTRESALAAAGSILSRAQNWPAAERVWHKARDVNPWIVRYWTELALCQARQRRWDACRATCEETLGRFPDSFGARQLLIECQLVAGKAEEAQREYERLLAIGPPKADSIRRWWQEHPLRGKPPPQP